MHFDTVESGLVTSQESQSITHSDAHSVAPEQSSGSLAASYRHTSIASPQTVPHPLEDVRATRAASTTLGDAEATRRPRRGKRNRKLDLWLVTAAHHNREGRGEELLSGSHPPGRELA